MKILFACVENSCRSQIAEAFAKIHSPEDYQVYSAGSKPTGVINSTAIGLLADIGYDLGSHTCNSLEDYSGLKFDNLVLMGCGEECPHLNADNKIEWDIPDPKNMNRKDFKEVILLIETEVLNLIDSF